MKFGSRPLFTPENIFVIPDIHNEADKLRAVLRKIEPLLGPNDHIVFSGDLFDRGPNAVAVLMIVADLKLKYPGRVWVVKGNHEQMMLDYIDDVHRSYPWIGNKGEYTLSQFKEQWNLPEEPHSYYGLDLVAPAVLKQAIIDRNLWHVFEELIPYYETEKVIVTHAPLDFTITQLYGAHKEGFRDDCLDRMSMEIMWKFTHEDNHQIPWIPKFMMCGHQFSGPQSKSPRIFKYRAFLDCGCGCRPERPALAFHFPSKKVYYSD